MTHKKLNTVQVTRTPHPKCPRCYRYTAEGHSNFDSLCDRCCEVLVKDFPDHEAVPHIKAAFRAERLMTAQQRRIRNHKIAPDEWPLSESDVAFMIAQEPIL